MNEVTTIDVTPSPEGFAAMMELSKESIFKYEKDIRNIARARLKLDTSQIGVRHPIPEEQIELIHAGLDLLEAQVEGSLDVLRDTVRELERCGY